MIQEDKKNIYARGGRKMEFTALVHPKLHAKSQKGLALVQMQKFQELSHSSTAILK